MGLMEALLEAHDLYRFYHAGEDETLALRGVSLALRRGETVAIVGTSGSGKSTLINCLAGLDEPDGGWVAVMGERMTRRSEAARAALRGRYIGILLQSGNLFEHLTVAGNVNVAACLSRRSKHLVGAEAALGAVRLAARSRALPAQLSGGELARAGLALAMVNEPPILLADEPTGEVDAANEAAVLDLLRERARNGGANLVVTHSRAVASMADRVLRLADGRLEDG
jgi:putative ABC transport system ATP-binding protein